MNIFLKDLQAQQVNQSIDNSFEVRWSLQELENIVYEFINAQQHVPLEFKSTLQRPLEAKIEDIMKIQRRENDKDEMLPSFVRELILQDRGNSLYLSDSFANLPSPVNETQNLKYLFKPKENEEDLNKNGNQKKPERDSNVQIRIEGKDGPSKRDGSFEEGLEKKVANIDVKELEKIVFASYNDSKKQQKVNQTEYVEEESYVNPTNVDYTSEADYIDQKLKSMNDMRGVIRQQKNVDDSMMR